MEAREVARAFGQFLVVANTAVLTLFACVFGLTSVGVGIFWATLVGACFTLAVTVALAIWTDRFRARG